MHFRWISSLLGHICGQRSSDGFVVQPLDSLQKMSNGLTCTRHHYDYSDLQRCCKNPKETSSTSHILPQILASGPDFRMDRFDLYEQLEPLWFFWWCFAVFFWPGERFKLKHGASYEASKSSQLWVQRFNCKNPPNWWCQKVAEKNTRVGVFLSYQGFLSYLVVYMIVWLVKYFRESNCSKQIDSQIHVWINLGALSWYSNNNRLKLINPQIITCTGGSSPYIFPPPQKKYMVTSQKVKKGPGPPCFQRHVSNGGGLSQDESWLVPGEPGAHWVISGGKEWDILRKTNSKRSWKSTPRN